MPATRLQMPPTESALGPPWRRIGVKDSWVWDSPQGLITIQRDERGVWLFLANDLVVQVKTQDVANVAGIAERRYGKFILNWVI